MHGMRRSPEGRLSDRALWTCAWGLTAVLIFFSLGPVPPGASAFRYADKVHHASLHAATVFLFLLAAVWRPGRGNGRYPRAVRWIVLAAAVGGFAASTRSTE
jgi:hypothetical protein